MSIIEKILLSKEAVKKENQQYVNSLKKEINWTNFFKEDDENGFITKEDFVKEIHTLNEYDLQKLEDFLKKISQKTRLYISPFPKKSDHTDRFYYLVKPFSQNVVSSYMLPAIMGIDKLIESYSQDYYSFDLNLTDLYNHAISS